MEREDNCGCGGHGHHHGGSHEERNEGYHGHHEHGGHHDGCRCRCHHSHGGMGFHRHFISQEERIARLEDYLKQLQAEAKGVEEKIAELKKTPESQ
jgi:hypothetical protein